jgi:hypothetical protein
MLFIAHGSPDSNTFFRCANALAHANTLAEIVKGQSQQFFRRN